MDLKRLEELMTLMRKHGLQELKIKDESSFVVLKLPVAGTVAHMMPHPMAAVAMPQPQVALEIPAAPKAAIKGHVVKSPFVGTYYGAPSPGAESFVRVGDRVKKGQVLCIVEAMKLMNEIEADVAGVVREILVQNEQPVEFDQALFIIE